MKKLVFTISLFFSLNWSLANNDPVLNISYLDYDPSFIRPGINNAIELTISSSTENATFKDSHNLFVWDKGGSNKYVILNQDIGLLNEFLNREITQQTVADEQALESVLRTILDMAYDPTKDIIFRNEKITGIQKKIMRHRLGDDVFNTFKDHINPLSFVKGKNSWKMERTVVSSDGSIIKHSIRGTLDPLNIKSINSELMAVSGTVPYFGYISGIEWRDEKDWDLCMDKAMELRKKAANKTSNAPTAPSESAPDTTPKKEE